MARSVILCCILAVTMSVGTALAQQPAPSQFDDLEARMSKLESGIGELAGTGYVIFLYAAFCALWAQNSGRNAWLWFLLGGVFHWITVLAVLYHNSVDKKLRGRSS